MSTSRRGAVIHDEWGMRRAASLIREHETGPIPLALAALLEAVSDADAANEDLPDSVWSLALDATRSYLSGGACSCTDRACSAEPGGRL